MVFVWFLYRVVKVHEYSDVTQECNASIFRVTKSGSTGCPSNWQEGVKGSMAESYGDHRVAGK